MSQEVFQAFSKEFKDLLTTFSNTLDRKRPEKWADNDAIRLLMRLFVKVSENTLDTIRFLMANKPANPARKPEYILSVSPLARTILDTLFTVVFMFEDLPERSKWYVKAGWRELYEENQRFQKRYGADKNKEDWLGEHTRLLEVWKKLAGISPSEEANPNKNILRWLNPGRMVDYKNGPRPRRDYLLYLNVEFYKPLSQDSHLSFLGLPRRSMALFSKGPQGNWDEELLIVRTECLLNSAMFLLSILTEIEVEMQYGMQEKLKCVWTFLCDLWPDAKELYDRFYRNRLS